MYRKQIHHIAENDHHQGQHLHRLQIGLTQYPHIQQPNGDQLFEPPVEQLRHLAGEINPQIFAHQHRHQPDAEEKAYGPQQRPRPQSRYTSWAPAPR